jgi:DNA-directed RNA polymerase subunit RPC12/RpoP
MTIKFECLHCGQHISSDSEQAGQGGNCPNCNQRIIVPQTPAPQPLPVRKEPDRVKPTTSPETNSLSWPLLRKTGFIGLTLFSLWLTAGLLLRPSEFGTVLMVVAFLVSPLIPLMAFIGERRRLREGRPPPCVIPIPDDVMYPAAVLVAAMLLFAFYFAFLRSHPSAPIVAAPYYTPLPSKPKTTPQPEPSADERQRLATGIKQARQKIELMLRVSRLNMDIAVSEKSYFLRGTPTVNIQIQLVSADGVRSFQDGSLRRNVYPTLEAAYREGLREAGFSQSSVQVYTDVTK